MVNRVVRITLWATVISAAAWLVLAYPAVETLARGMLTVAGIEP